MVHARTQHSSGDVLPVSKLKYILETQRAGMGLYQIICPDPHSSLVNDLIKVICFQHNPPLQIPSARHYMGCQATEDIWIVSVEEFRLI